MGLPWVRLDTTLPRNHKILDLLDMRDGHRSAFVYTCALAYSGEQGTGGFIPRSALPFIHARNADIDRLVSVRLLIPDEDGGGWDIHQWADFQLTSEEIEERAKRARNAARVRWAKTRKAPTKHA